MAGLEPHLLIRENRDWQFMYWPASFLSMHSAAGVEMLEVLCYQCSVRTQRWFWHQFCTFFFGLRWNRSSGVVHTVSLIVRDYPLAFFLSASDSSIHPSCSLNMNKIAATCVHTSPSPAIQLQWAEMISPEVSQIIQWLDGVSLHLWILYLKMSS